MEARGRRQRGPQPVALGQGEHVEVGPPLGQPLAVAGAGVGDDEHPGAREVGPPAQVEVVAVEVDVVREAAERAEEVDAHEQAGRRHAEDVAHGVVLLLVQLAGLGRLERHADAVGAQAHVLQHRRPVPVDQLRPDDAGVGAVRLGHQLADGRRVERHVVVQEAEEAGALDQLQGLVGRRPEPRVVAEGPHERVRQPLADVGHHPRLSPRDQEEQAEVRVVLAGDRVEHLVEPRPGLVHHHHGHDRGAPPVLGRPAVGSSITTVGRG